MSAEVHKHRSEHDPLVPVCPCGLRWEWSTTYRLKDGSKATYYHDEAFRQRWVAIYGEAPRDPPFVRVGGGR